MIDRKEYNRQWQKDNPKKIKQYNDNAKEYKHQWYLYNHKRQLDLHKKWRKDNPDYIKKYSKKYYKENSEKIKKRVKLWVKNNPQRKKESYKKWKLNNVYKVRKYTRQWENNRYKIDIKYNINRKISRAIQHSLKDNKGGRHWEDLVGYTLKDLIKRLKKTMPKGYDWNDYLEGKLHVDHIIPISVWNFDNSEQINFQKCWALKNLQLLPAKENMIKHDKLTKPFQPALAI